jgi:hypothetical protein
MVRLRPILDQNCRHRLFNFSENMLECKRLKFATRNLSIKYFCFILDYVFKKNRDIRF